MTNIRSNMIPSLIEPEDREVLDYLEYDNDKERIKTLKAVETTLNSIHLGDQHKISSGAENIFFTNNTSDINFFPMWGGLKNQSIAANQGASGYIAPSGRVYGDMISLPLRGNPVAGTSTGYIGDNPFGVNIAGLGITTRLAETIPDGVKLVYRLHVPNAAGKQVYEQELKYNNPAPFQRSAAQDLTWYFDHPVEIHAGMTIHAAIYKVDEVTGENLGVLQVQRGSNAPSGTTGLYWATVHNRLFEDKDLEFLSPHLKATTMDFTLDATKSHVVFRDHGANNSLSNHNINSIQAIANGTTIQIKVKNGAKILIDALPVSGASIGGVAVNGVLATAVNQLNGIFTNTQAFDVNTGNPVTALALEGTPGNINDVRVTFQDGTSTVIDFKVLDVDTDNTVASGAIVGNNLVLTMSDGSTVTINGANLVNGVGVTMGGPNYFILNGSASGQEITTSTMQNNLKSHHPHYYGNLLTKGNEFLWTHDVSGNLHIGVYNSTTVGQTVSAEALWSCKWFFTVATQSNPSQDAIQRPDSASTTGSIGNNMATLHSADYDISSSDRFALRYQQNDKIALYDITGGKDVLIGESSDTFSGGQVIAVTGQAVATNTKYPVFTERKETFTIVHDFDNSEGGEWRNGIEPRTIIKTNIEASPGQKIVWSLPADGNNRYYGHGYVGASSGESSAQGHMVGEWRQQIIGEFIQNASEWTFNTAATLYNGSGSGGAAWYNSTGSAVTVSYRYINNTTLEMWDEDREEKIMTWSGSMDGTPFSMYYGSNAYTTNAELIPAFSRQNLTESETTSSTQHAPQIDNYVLNVTESQGVNHTTTLASTNLVTMYSYEGLPSWLIGNQASGVLMGTAPAYDSTTTSNNTMQYTVKGANPYGLDSGVVTLNVLQNGYTNTKSINFQNSDYLQAANPGNISALARSNAGGEGDADAWAITFWYKGQDVGTSRVLLFAGSAASGNTAAFIELRITATKQLRFQYGRSGNYIRGTTNQIIADGTWRHIQFHYNGSKSYNGAAGQLNSYAVFEIYIDGVRQRGSGSSDGLVLSHNASGYANSIVMDRFRICRGQSALYAPDDNMEELAIWDRNMKDYTTHLYNGGNAHNLAIMTHPPAHYWRMGDGDTYPNVLDSVGGSGSNLTMYNMSALNIENDVP